MRSADAALTKWPATDAVTAVASHAVTAHALSEAMLDLSPATAHSQTQTRFSIMPRGVRRRKRGGAND
jgi:hypothetical protein